MATIKKAAGQTAASTNSRPNYNKETMILTIMRAGQSLNTFEAQRLGDTCLNSTISTLRGKGYLFHDEWEWVPNRFGGETRVKRYWHIGQAHGEA
jgi:hypothetical protein